MQPHTPGTPFAPHHLDETETLTTTGSIQRGHHRILSSTASGAGGYRILEDHGAGRLTKLILKPLDKIREKVDKLNEL